MLLLTSETQDAALEALDITACNTSQNLQFPSYDPANEKIACFHETDSKIRALFGGNRSGKSESGGYELVKLARQFPGETFWAATVSYDAVGAYVWEKLKKYLHPDEIRQIAWTNKAKHIPSLLLLQNGSQIYCKSYDSGREKFQGASIKGIWLDEEPPEDIYIECLARTVDCQGYLLLSMTPLKGLTWCYDRIYQQSNIPGDDIRHWTISLFENKYIPESEKQRLLALYTQDEIEKRVYGRFMRLEGAVWKELDERIHFIPRFAIPSHWRRIRVIDFGYSNPFACLWMAMNEDKEIYVYQEYYKAETLLKDHATTILQYDSQWLQGGYYDSGFEATVADHDAQDREELRQYGIITRAAKKDIQLGIQITNRRLKIKPNGRASLYIFNDLVNTIRETRNYHYPEKKTNRNTDEVPVKEDDHCMDCLRYGVMYFDGLEKRKSASVGKTLYKHATQPTMADRYLNQKNA